MQNSKIIKYLVERNPRGEAQLSRAKRQIAKKFKLKTLSNIVLLELYRKAIKNKKIQSNTELEKLLKTREIRTLSGVAPVAVLTKPYPCPGKCAFCPNEKEMPKSYLSNEPAVMRAIGSNFNPYKQIRTRIEALTITGHNTDKIELIIMGGTWSYLETKYQNWFIKKCFEAMNNSATPPIRGAGGFAGKRNNLIDAMKKNEKAKHRCVGLTLETRPDYINLKEIKRMRQLGCTKVELGVQAIDDEILKLNKRGNTVQQIIDATKLLKDAGFKIVYHIMPNLPGSSSAKDVKMYKELFSNPDFQPDMVKIYPCVVTKNSEIYRWFKKGTYKPYSDKQLFGTLLKMKEATPPYVRIIRLIRDIPAESIIAGGKISNLRQNLQKELTLTGKKCQCIRCREIKNINSKIKNQELKIREYNASGGVEYFLSFEDTEEDKLLAFLRLRIQPRWSLPLGDSCVLPLSRRSPLAGDSDEAGNVDPTARGVGGSFKIFPELQDCAIIREVHTYGELAPVNIKGKVQHLGFGKKLIKKAEEIALENGYKKMAVIAAVGTRGYYRKLGYRLSGDYMVKNI
ncbi:MAG: tRNA uridine(34) 5-carboxymethylaminomethyl modification radical SAM/GNAT enzyme Elp3 [bacterium]